MPVLDFLEEMDIHFNRNIALDQSTIEVIRKLFINKNIQVSFIVFVY